MNAHNYQRGIWSPPKLDEAHSPQGKPYNIGVPLLGLNWREKRSHVSKDEVPYCVNAIIAGGAIKPRPGHDLLYNTFDDTIMYIGEFHLASGLLYFVAITVKSLYNSADLTVWTRVPWYYTTGTVSTTNGSKIVTGSSTAWLANARAGDRFKVDASGTWYVIASVGSNTQITLTTNFSGTYSGQAYHIDRYFGGSSSNKFWGLTIPDEDLFIFSQGVDPVLYVNSDISQLQRLSADCPAACLGMPFSDRIIIANLAATDMPWLIQWCAAGDWDNWTGTGSGNQPLAEDTYPINAMSVIGGVGVIYKERSIHHMTRTGKASDPFDIKTRIRGIGCYTLNMIMSTDTVDILLSHNNFYEYDLGAPKPIGDKIIERFLAVLDPSYKDTCHAVMDVVKGNAQFYFPHGGSTSPDAVLVWDYRRKLWMSEWSLATNASGQVRSSLTDTWDSAVGTWDTDDEPWDAAAAQSNFPIILIGSGTSLYEQNTTKSDDGGSAFTFEYHISDIVPPEVKELSVFRIIVCYYCSLSGADLSVDVTRDGGVTFESGGVFTLESTNPSVLKYAFFDFIFTGEVVGARVKCVGGIFDIVDVRLELDPSGEINE